ncbi:MAG: ECF transporter S component [Oscillospiraceae bacterium]|nr:ECF transporter S component [Oscillospiraceae bacterium]
MRTNSEYNRMRRMTGLSIFTAIILVLTVICTFIRFGPFSITLALTPIIIGGALYGTGAGAYLGGVFGLVVLLTGILGWDGGTVMYLLSINPIGCILICLVKGAAAGYLSALLYRLLARRSEKAAVVVAAVACPVVNTGLFLVGMAVFFFAQLGDWAAAEGQAIGYYIIVSLTGINFVVELLVNLLLSSGITRIIRAGKAGR